MSRFGQGRFGPIFNSRLKAIGVEFAAHAPPALAVETVPAPEATPPGGAKDRHPEPPTTSLPLIDKDDRYKPSAEWSLRLAEKLRGERRMDRDLGYIKPKRR